MVYSIVFVQSENLLQLKWFESDAACSAYHEYVSWTWPFAFIQRKHSWSAAIAAFKALSINLKE